MIQGDGFKLDPGFHGKILEDVAVVVSKSEGFLEGP